MVARILVIEDTKDLREDLMEMLQLEGYTVFGAENGVRGLQLIKYLRPDLVICDVMMPELDGYSLLSAMRQDPEVATTPFIFLTARTERDSIRHGMVLGADDYVTKPFTVQDLIDTIRTQLDKRRDLDDRVQRQIDKISSAIVRALPHELRTPLNSILGFSELLMNDADSLTAEQVAQWANHINSAGQRLYNLIEGYLYYARLQVQIGSTVDLQEPVASYDNIVIVTSERVAARYRRIDDLEVNVMPAPVLAVNYVDAVKLLTELVDNAFKFSSPRQPVCVSGRVEGVHYVLEIADKGRGMQPHQVKQLGTFMQFDRTMYEQQGLGLGLATTQLLAQLYQTHFEIDSSADGGTVARFLLPVQ